MNNGGDGSSKNSSNSDSGSGSGGGSKINGGAVAGGVIAGLAVLAGVAAVVVLRRRKAVAPLLRGARPDVESGGNKGSSRASSYNVEVADNPLFGGPQLDRESVASQDSWGEVAAGPEFTPIQQLRPATRATRISVLPAVA